MRSMLAILLVFAPLAVAETGSIRGLVVSTNGEPLPGVNVLVQGTVRGTTTSASGEFSLSGISVGTYTIVFSLVGYQREQRSKVDVREGQALELRVVLTSAPIQTEPVVVTASKREQSLQESPVSMAVMDATEIARRNSVTIDDALRYISGVNLTESQVNIRGSSGYSRGAGSRVLMLVDGIPFITGDTGELNFETIPVGQVERIEVVKGASSALYGSSALGGVINVITKPIPAEPATTLRTYGGFYGAPSFSQWVWGGGTRFLDGQALTHSRTIGSLGLMLHGSRIADDGFRQNDFRRRYNGYVKVRAPLSDFDLFTSTFNILHQKRASFLYWKDLTHALTPPDVQQGDGVQSTRFFLSSQYNHITGEDAIYTVRGMWFRTKFTDTIGPSSEGSRSDVIRGEALGTFLFDGGHILTAGVEGNLDRVDADVWGTHSGGGVAMYVQAEYAVAPWFKVTVGARYDHQDLDSLDANAQLNPKLGIVYNPMPGTAVRASYGRGFRSPTVAEAFISTSAGGFPIIPNPNLKPERSTSYEVGVNQILGEAAVCDVALFQSDFSDLIEAGFTPNFNGQFANVTRAQIRGVEGSATLGFFDRSSVLSLGYTYVHPKDVTKNDILKYRPRHMLYAGSVSRISDFTLAVDFRYLSRVERIDDEFVTPPLNIIKDGEYRVDIYVVDLRFGYDFAAVDLPLIATLNINNLFQYNYVELIGNIAPPRSIILTLQTSL
ncbi:MAG: Iron complex outer rane receptor protein [Bacteroidetes bacterium]|nr:Iron complex outer rane receptor protein [Bacteroidota bacterium]